MAHFANLKNLFRPINSFVQIHDVNKSSSMYCLNDFGTVVLEKNVGVRKLTDGKMDGRIVYIINLLIKSIYI